MPLTLVGRKLGYEPVNSLIYTKSVAPLQLTDYTMLKITNSRMQPCIAADKYQACQSDAAIVVHRW